MVQVWLSNRPEAQRAFLEKMLSAHFYKALDWVATRCEIEQSRLGRALNGLCQLRDVVSKPEFVCGLIRGLGGNLLLSVRMDFAKEVFSWCRESVLDARRPLDVCCVNGQITALKG